MAKHTTLFGSRNTGIAVGPGYTAQPFELPANANPQYSTRKPTQLESAAVRIDKASLENTFCRGPEPSDIRCNTVNPVWRTVACPPMMLFAQLSTSGVKITCAEFLWLM